jgi:hypothetical protein
MAKVYFKIFIEKIVSDIRLLGTGFLYAKFVLEILLQIPH